MFLVVASALGQPAKKTTKKKKPAQATQQVDGDGNPIPSTNRPQPAAQTPVTPTPAPTPVQQTPAPAPQTTQTPAQQSPANQPAPETQKTKVCSSTDLADGASIDIPPAVIGGGVATFSLTNPMLGKNATAIKVHWQHPNATAPMSTNPKPLPFTLGYCGPDPNDASKSSTQYFAQGSDYAELAKAQAIIIRFEPNDAGKFQSTLQLSWKEEASDKSKTYPVTGDGGAPDYAKDSRYKLWAYTGFTFLRSQNDFNDSFAELLVRIETRWIDERIAMKQREKDLYDRVMKEGMRCNDERTPAAIAAATWSKREGCAGATFNIVRIYGEAGLTGTTATSTVQSAIGGAQESFAGGFGVGIGKTRLVSVVRPEDTSAFSLLFLPRLGLTSIPAETGHPETAFTAYDYSVNVRIENEPSLDEKNKAGNFEGAYFEFGFGESERFLNKKFPRLRADGYLPIPGGSDLFRFAMRLQIDAPRPFTTKKVSSKTNPTPGDTLANEIRISALFNLNLLELGKRMSGAK